MFRILNMSTVCCCFAHSLKIMRILQPSCFEVVPPLTIQRLSYFRGGEGDVWFTRCIEGREPEIYGLWTFADDGIHEVHLYVWVKISDKFIGETFHTHFSNAWEVQIPFLGRRSVNGSVQWLDVPQPFGETGIATAAWTENIYVNLWGANPTRIPNVPINRRATFTNVPIYLRAVARRSREKLLWDNRVERRKTLHRELHARILLDIREEVLSDDSDDGLLEEDWPDW